MTNEEREIITRFIGRVGGATQPGGFGGGASGTPAPLPPVDKEADDLIGQLFTQYPEARYRITQMAFVQEAALGEAQNRMRQMQWEVEQAHQQAAQGQQQHRGFFGGLFGGGGAPQGGGPAPGTAPPQQQRQYAPPPPPPQYAAPQYQPGMFQRSGSGFLGSALTTAAGVAGGLVAGNALMDLFSGNRGGFGGGFGGGGFGAAPGTENVVNNFYGDQSGGADPWGAGGAAPVDPGAGAGGADPWGAGGAAPDQGQADPGQADPGWGNAGTAGNAGTSGTGGAGGATGGGGGWDDTTNT